MLFELFLVLTATVDDIVSFDCEKHIYCYQNSFQTLIQTLSKFFDYNKLKYYINFRFVTINRQHTFFDINFFRS